MSPPGVRRHGRGHGLAVQIAVTLVAASVALGALSLMVLAPMLARDGASGDATLVAATISWAVASFAMTAVASVFVSRRVALRLRGLAARADEAASGGAGAASHVDVVRDGSEIGAVASGLEAMARALTERGACLERRLVDLSALHESSRIVGSASDPDALLEGALRSAVGASGADIGYVALRGDSGDVHVRAVHGVADTPSSRRFAETSMAAWVVREGRPLVFAASGGEDDAHRDTITGARVAVSVPLISPEGVIGALTVGRADDGGERFGADDVRLLGTIANHVTTALGTCEAFGRVHEAYVATVRSLAAAVDAKDSYTRGHSDRVARYAALTAAEMGLSPDQRLSLEMSAYLHDIGKIGIPEEILLKPGRLDPDETETMRTHPLIGANILEPVSFPWPITPVVRHHHERWDGTGYPAGLKGTRIPVLARVLAVADAYEAMIAERPYRCGMTAEEGLAELQSAAGSQFDPEVVAAFAAAGPRIADATLQ
ncbi:MAG TPA: HD domain-containing phosphohydrolase [Coriobacteriia bacterium]|nr:HD domain-containing phosphohydrolase [Coriobacteriia bacterium]